MTVHVDGSTGEGGGQVLRTSLALSAVSGEPVEIEDVRGGRDEPGLRPQHLACVRALADLTDAEVEGAEEGSRRVLFEPGPPEGGEYTVDVGTAGSVTLVVHALLPAALHADGDVRLVLHGGTHVRWSPTYEHLSEVFVPLLRESGADVDAELVRRGHYPEGGGEVALTVSPSDPPLSRVEPRRSAVERFRVVSHASGLPEDIVGRQTEAARESLAEALGDVPIETEETHVGGGAPSKGTAVTVVAEAGTRLGGSALGEPGKPAEEVGRDAADELAAAVASGADVDRYTADQLVPYVAFASDGGSYDVPETTSHLGTNVEVASWFYDVSLRERVSSGPSGKDS